MTAFREFPVPTACKLLPRLLIPTEAVLHAFNALSGLRGQLAVLASSVYQVNKSYNKYSNTTVIRCLLLSHVVRENPYVFRP